MTPAPERPARQRVSDDLLTALLSHVTFTTTQEDNLALDLHDARATIAGLREENERLIGERDTAKTQFAEEYAIVARIWTQLGSPSYQELAGRSIYDLIDELKTRAEAALARLTQPDEAMVEALRKIAKPLDCGCRPCTGQCRSAENLQVELEVRQDIAAAALAALRARKDELAPAEPKKAG